MTLLQVKPGPDGAIATLTARSLTEANVGAVAKELSALVGQLGGQSLVLDLGAVEFVSSMGLGKLLSLSKKVREGGGQLSLRNVRSQVYEVLVTTRLTDILDVQPAHDGGGGHKGSA
jgi:anti-anti-sigma factor